MTTALDLFGAALDALGWACRRLRIVRRNLAHKGRAK